MRWKTHLPVADLARWANGRSALFRKPRLRAAYGGIWLPTRGERFAFSLVRGYVTWW
jgi:hypothetical protein